MLRLNLPAHCAPVNALQRQAGGPRLKLRPLLGAHVDGQTEALVVEASCSGDVPLEEQDVSKHHRLQGGHVTGGAHARGCATREATNVYYGAPTSRCSEVAAGLDRDLKKSDVPSTLARFLPASGALISASGRVLKLVVRAGRC